LIKACQSSDKNIFALGVDLENDVGLPMNQDEPLGDSLLSPWYDEVAEGQGHKNTSGLLGFEGSFINKSSSASIDNRRPSALDSIIPSCYHIPSLPSALAKIASFSDETLFYIFYAMPGDRMQELAARELYSRNWRFYKPAKAWVCPVDSKDNANTLLNTKGPVNFFLFDQSAWIKVKRSIQLQVDDLELSRPTNSGTASPISSPEIMHGSGTLQSTAVTH
jgi:CCR4-NOT transcription complex subunit 2